MMKHIIFLIIITLSLVVKVEISGAKTKPLTDPINTVRDIILSYFPPVKGVIKDVKDGYVRVQIESDVNLHKGTRLFVYRKAEVFYHPLTKEPLGRSEVPVGRIEVIRKEEGFYLCSKVRGDIKDGDVARITSSRIKLAFFQRRRSDWLLSQSFYDSLKESGRFEILETYTKTYEPEGLSKISRGLGAEAFLLLSTPLRDGKRFLNVDLYWTEDIVLFTRVHEPVSADSIDSLLPGGGFLSFGAVDTEPWGSYDIETGELIAMGDVDGNGSEELVVSDGTKIRIYSFKDEPREIWTINGKAGERHLSVDILDMNENGRGEIFVTSITGVESTITRDESEFKSAGPGSINSFVIEYEPGGGYKRIKEGMPYFFRVVNDRLLMQGFSMNDIFSGAVYEGQWKNGEYKLDKPLKLPDGVDIYGFAYIDWRNNGDTYLLSFDTEGYLILYKAGEVVWRSKESFGRFYLTFERATHSITTPIKKWCTKGRLVTLRTDRGQESIVLKKNPVLSNVPGLGYSDFSVYSLWWDGDVMEENLIMGALSGTPTDYLLKGDELFIIARGSLFSFIKKAFSGEFSRGSKLYYYKFIKR
jgi:hypothetical protein